MSPTTTLQPPTIFPTHLYPHPKHPTTHQVIIEWGYLLLFGAAFPLCVVMAAFTNFLETRTDGLKLLRDFRRVRVRVMI